MPTQSNLGLGTWQVTVNRTWVDRNSRCTRTQISPDIWHHFQTQAHHDASVGSGTYSDALAVDGKGAALGCVSTSENLG
jgi:hypothetical protein